VITRNHLLVGGLVQGVFYRDTCRRLARQEGVAGWVRNLSNGYVEAVFEGEADAVQRLTAWARTGPDAARVDSVDVRPEPPEGLRSFEILPDAAPADAPEQQPDQRP
jgi:acylphosphatase